MQMGRCFGFANSRIIIGHCAQFITRLVFSGLIFFPTVFTSIALGGDKLPPFRDPHFPALEKSTYEVNQKGQNPFPQPTKFHAKIRMVKMSISSQRIPRNWLLKHMT